MTASNASQMPTMIYFTVIDREERICQLSHPENTDSFALLDSQPQMTVALLGQKLN